MRGGLEEEYWGADVSGLLIELHDKPGLELSGGVGEDDVGPRITAHTLQGQHILQPEIKCSSQNLYFGG